MSSYVTIMLQANEILAFFDQSHLKNRNTYIILIFSMKIGICKNGQQIRFHVRYSNSKIMEKMIQKWEEYSSFTLDRFLIGLIGFKLIRADL